VSSQHERYHNHYIPTDHTDVKEVHHPQPPPDSQHQEHCNHLAEHYTADATEVDGEGRDEWIYFKPARAERSQSRKEIQHLKQNENGSCVQRSQE